MHDTQVLIIGGSLVGLSAAAFLAFRGVKTIVIEKHAGSALHPRATGFTERTMEFYRAIGIDRLIPTVDASFRLRRATVDSLAGSVIEESDWTPPAPKAAPAPERELSPGAGKPEHGFGTAKGLIDHIGIGMRPLNNFRLIPCLLRQFVWMADDDADGLLGIQQLVKNMAADISGRGCDDNHREPHIVKPLGYAALLDYLCLKVPVFFAKVWNNGPALRPSRAPRTQELPDCRSQRRRGLGGALRKSAWHD